MSNIDKRALREAAEKATKGQWAVGFEDEVYSTDGVNNEQIAMVFSQNEARDAEFIATANPATVLALLDELESADGYASAYEAEKWHYHGLAESEGERAERAEKECKQLLEKLSERTEQCKQLASSLEAAENHIAEQREYYEGVIADGSRRIAELEAREINLPPYSFFDFKQGSPFKNGAYCHLDAVNAELAKHGIKIVTAAGIGKGGNEHG